MHTRLQLIISFQSIQYNGVAATDRLKFVPGTLFQSTLVLIASFRSRITSRTRSTSSMASAGTPATTADLAPAGPPKASSNSSSSSSAQAASLSKDKRIAEHASGRPVNLQGNKTLDFGDGAPDELQGLEHDSGLHVFSAGYDVYALPKHQ
jgi:hypothetical protein